MQVCFLPLLMLISLLFCLFFVSRNFLVYLLMIELFMLLCLYIMMLCPFEWVHIITYLLVIGASEAALGLSVLVKISRSFGNDRIAVSSFL